MRKRIEIVTNIAKFTWLSDDPMPEDWAAKQRATPWNDCGDVLMRILYVPEGMACREADVRSRAELSP
jgi:hypothetical protein